MPIFVVPKSLSRNPLVHMVSFIICINYEVPYRQGRQRRGHRSYPLPLHRIIPLAQNHVSSAETEGAETKGLSSRVIPQTKREATLRPPIDDRGGQRAKGEQKGTERTKEVFLSECFP